VALTGDEEGPVQAALKSESPQEPPPRSRRREEAQTIGEQSLLTSAATVQEFKAGEVLERLIHTFGPRNVFLEIQRHRRRGEERMNRALVDLARAHRLPLLATNGVQHDAPEGRQVVDVFTCLRHHTTLDAAGRLLTVNRERHLKSAAQMQV